MIQTRLRMQLDRVAARYRRLRTWQVLAVVWLVAALLGAVVLGVRIATSLPASAVIPVLCLAPCVLAAVGLWWVFRSAANEEWVARQLEQRFPDLKQSLLAAIELRPDLPDGRFGFLQASVIQQALDHSRKNPWAEIVSRRQLLFAAFANIAAFLLFVVVVVAVARFVPPAVAAGLVAEPLKALLPGSGFAVTVEPGDTEVEKGTSLLVLARIAGTMPPQATLHFHPEGGEASSLAMSASLSDPVFGGRISQVDQTLTYHVDVEGQVSPTYRATVFEYPRLERADAKLVFPAYTGMEERLLQDVRTVSVVEGTSVTLRCKLNKPVTSAVLADLAKENPQPSIALVPIVDLTTYEVTLLCTETRKYRLDLVDYSERKNVKPVEFRINVNPNRPPTIKPLFPGRDMELSAIEELDVRATIVDDFGLPKAGVSYSLAGKDPVDVTLIENGKARDKREIASQIRLEELDAKPDELLSYFWWADDIGPDGQLRRTSSDMYFGEVRPFEELFRQGQAQPRGAQQQQQQQGQSPAGQQAEELAKLQKDIMSATWKVLRREITKTVTPAFQSDVEQLEASQQQALEMANELRSKVQDEKSKGYVQDILRHMSTAITELERSHDKQEPEALRPALSAEQAAYQGLLKLRAREHEIVRQQQQQGQGQGAGRSQQQRQQMNQLDLKDQESRYETERTAQQRQEETAEQRENRQVLNRLRELARRQTDLNERLKELQTALTAAETEQQKEEVRKQLKRLQDEQRQILQDTEELQSRLDQPENAERLTEQREQLQETREEVRKASESLENERVTQAAAAGTRAEEQFDELREEFRRRASEGFTDEMRQMRQAARELDEKEKELAQQIKDEASPPMGQAPTLREQGPQGREKIGEELSRQRQRFSDLQEQMRQTIDEAAETEPLLSERLYETARDARDTEVDRALQVSEQAIRRGFAEDAQRIESIANQGIEKLRQGIEKAADGVIGDDTESLRRARQELQTLSQDLSGEMTRNGAEPPQRPEDRAPQDGAAGGQREGSEGPMSPQHIGEDPSQPGQPGGESPMPGEGERPGQGRRSQSQPGRETPGEGASGEPMERQPGERPGQGTGERSETEAPMPGQPGQQPGSQPGQGRGQRSPMNGGSPMPGEQPGGEPMPAGEPGEQPMEGQAGQSPSGQSPSGQGQQPGGQQPGQQGQRGQQGQSGQQGEADSPMPGEGQGQGGGQGDGNRPRGDRTDPRQRGARQPSRLSDGPRPDGSPNGGGAITSGGGNIEMVPQERSPLVGEDFREWSDRLRDVEEMVDDPEMRALAARIREQARAMRAEFKRHSKEPNWDLVRRQVAEPLIELENRVAQELLRRAGKKALVPLDRDPVAPEYAEKTRRYYERLGGAGGG